MPESSNDMILGEMRGQLREVVHGQNNLSQKFDALTREVIGLSQLAVQVSKLETSDTAIDVRLTALETDRNRRDGATGLLQMILKSPALGWLAGAVVTVWALLSGKVDV